MRPLILASTSPWRRKILENAGIAIEAIGPGVDERAVPWVEPGALVAELARRKCRAVAGNHPDRYVLGADQVLFDGEDVYGKPENPAQHLEMLLAMRGKAHTLWTGWCIEGPGGVAIEGVKITEMVVRADLSVDEVRRYVETGEGSGCAGGYAAEGLGVFLFERIDGDWFNVQGLPLLDVLGALRSLGWRFGEGT